MWHFCQHHRVAFLSQKGTHGLGPALGIICKGPRVLQVIHLVDNITGKLRCPHTWIVPKGHDEQAPLPINCILPPPRWAQDGRPMHARHELCMPFIWVYLMTIVRLTMHVGRAMYMIEEDPCMCIYSACHALWKLPMTTT